MQMDDGDAQVVQGGQVAACLARQA